MHQRDSSRLSNASFYNFKQQRRGPSPPHKKAVYDSAEEAYPSNVRDSIGSYDVYKKRSWLEKIRLQTAIGSGKGHVVLQTHFPSAMRGLYSARFCHDQDRFVTAYGCGVIQMWHVEADSHCVDIRNSPDDGLPIMCIRFVANEQDDTFFAASACGTLFICHMREDDYAPFAVEQLNEINSVDISLDSVTVITGGKDATLRLYDIETKKSTGKYGRNTTDSSQSTAKFHKMRIFAVKFHPSFNSVFLSGGWDDVVKVWDIRVKGGSIRDIKGPHICGDAIAIYEDTVLTGSWTVDNSLQLWDLSSGKLIENINPYNRPITIDGEFLYTCQYFRGDASGSTVVAGGSGTGNVEVIDRLDKKVISNFKVYKSIQAIDTSSKYMLYGGMESTFRVALI